MKRLVGWMAAALLAGAVLQGNAWAVQPLLTPAELKALQGGAGVRIIDIRSPKAYDDRHIPGAVSAPYGTWRGPAGNPGELPDLPRLTGLVQRLGLTPEVHAVVVSSGDDATDFGAAARVVWTLKALGLKQLSVLNGGVQAWVAAGMALDPMPEVVQASTYTPVLDRSLVATREELLSQTAGSVRLLDARPAAFFRGETRHQAALVPGTLKGAVNLEYTRWFAPDSSAMLPADEIKRLAAESSAAESSAAGDAPVVSFCNTGHWAAINWFALSEVAGQPGVKMYPGSLVDWSQSPGAAQAMDNVPGRAGQLWVDFKLWWARTFD